MGRGRGGGQKINSLSADSYPIDTQADVKQEVTTKQFHSHGNLH